MKSQPKKQPATVLPALLVRLRKSEANRKAAAARNVLSDAVAKSELAEKPVTEPAPAKADRKAKLRTVAKAEPKSEPAPKPVPAPAPKASPKVSAYRAHRTMALNKMKGASKTVRATLAKRVAHYDTLISEAA